MLIHDTGTCENVPPPACQWYYHHNSAFVFVEAIELCIVHLCKLRTHKKKFCAQEEGATPEEIESRTMAKNISYDYLVLLLDEFFKFRRLNDPSAEADNEKATWDIVNSLDQQIRYVNDKVSADSVSQCSASPLLIDSTAPPSHRQY